MGASAAREHSTAKSVFAEGAITGTILRFAAPTILSLLVNTFYNIADQAFIGHGVGYAGNAAVNVVYPVATFSVAMSALISDGASAYMSLSLGRKEKDRASDCVAAALALAAAVSLVILVVGQLIARPLLEFLAATDSIMDMAMVYLRIILLGIPCVVVGAVLSALIRADGSPKYAMFCMVPGCLVNVVLDALFIFAFQWEIAGAAWATVIGQAVNLLIAVAYLPRFQMVDVFRRGERHLVREAGCFLRLGLAGFINQFSGTVYVVFINRYLEIYGAMSVYGADIPLAVFGIMMKVSQVAVCFMSGIAVGMQPILGYCYGEENYERVKKCLKTGVGLATACGVVFFVVFEVLPGPIMMLFGQTDPAYIDFGVKCFRIFLLAAPLYGFSIVSTGLFQAIGKPIYATFMALSRQIIYLLPLIMFLAPRYGVVGMLWASPIGDVFAFTTCFIIYLREWHLLSRKKI